MPHLSGQSGDLPKLSHSPGQKKLVCTKLREKPASLPASIFVYLCIYAHRHALCNWEKALAFLCYPANFVSPSRSSACRSQGGRTVSPSLPWRWWDSTWKRRKCEQLISPHCSGSGKKLSKRRPRLNWLGWNTRKSKATLNIYYCWLTISFYFSSFCSYLMALFLSINGWTNLLTSVFSTVFTGTWKEQDP